MDHKDLEGKTIVLSYSFGPLFNKAKGGECALTIWEVKEGELIEVYHPGEPKELDHEKPLRVLKERGINRVYSPSQKLLLENEDFLGLRRNNDGDGESFDYEGFHDWTEYSSLCMDSKNQERLKAAGLEITILG